MRYAIDCEFIEDGITIELISLAIVREDGRHLYVQNHNCDFSRASDWVVKHVFPHLMFFDADGPILFAEDAYPPDYPWLFYSDIADAVCGFIGDDATPIFWGYYAAYDWVALCQCFGTMMELPAGWPMYCHDLRQLLDERGQTEVIQPDMPHNALSDAQWIMKTLLEQKL